jgi:hypothetical protein
LGELLGSWLIVDYSRMYSVRASTELSVAKGLFLMSDGQVLVEYDKRRRGSISRAQYKANGYRPACDKLPAEAPSKRLKDLAHAEA